jgi:multimeric flavodoxin WrbA
VKTLLLVFHSRTDGTRQMAEAAWDAAAGETRVAVRVVTAETAGSDDLLTADGIIFAAPENLAALSGPMKDFFDRTYYPVLGRIEGRPYATMICAGSDGENAARQIARIATGWRLRPIAEPLIVCTRAQMPEAILTTKIIAPDDRERCRALGATFAAGLDLGIF